MDRGSTLKTVETYHCPNCAHESTGVDPEDAGFKPVNRFDGAVKCPKCEETMNPPR